METLFVIYIVCLVIGSFLAIEYLVRNDQIKAKDVAIATLLVVFNVPFLLCWFIKDSTEEKKKKRLAIAAEKEHSVKVEHARSLLKYYDNNWRILMLNKDCNNIENLNCRLLYVILTEKGYPNHRLIDNDLLVEAYDELISPNLLQEVKAQNLKEV